MKRLMIAAAAVLAVGHLVSAGEPQSPPRIRVPWYKRWFGIGPEPPKPAPPPKPKDPAIEAANARAHAEADLIRRQNVCLELRQYAEEKDDPVLRAKVDALERQAWEIYKRQTAHLPCSRLVPTTEEKALDDRLGLSSTKASAEDRLLPPIQLSNRKAQASAVREVKP
jgi:hypothetical protein